MTLFNLSFIDRQGNLVTRDTIRSKIMLRLPPSEKTRNEETITNATISIFVSSGSTDTNPKNYVTIEEERNNDSKNRETKEYYDLDSEFVVRYQKENKLEVNYVSGFPSVNITIFSPIEYSRKINISEKLGVELPRYGSGDLTFKFLKSCFKALNMSGYSSKKKEDLLDEILERFTEDSKITPTVGSGIICRHSMPNDVHSLKPKSGRISIGDQEEPQDEPDSNLEEDTTYEDDIGIASRIIGKSFYLQNAEPTPDARILKEEYNLVRIKDPYDGLDQFLKEQEQK